MRIKPLVLICGAGRVGTAIAHRLYRAKMRVAITCQDDPQTLIRGNSYTQAAFTGTPCAVEGVSVRKAVVTEATSMIEQRVIPLLTADCRDVINVLNPDIAIDACMVGARQELSVGDASLVIGVNGGFEAGADCDAVIDATLGHDLGRIIYRGPVPLAPPLTGGDECFVTAGTNGTFDPSVRIGQRVKEGDEIARLGEQTVIAPCAGVISAMLQTGTVASEGYQLCSVDSRGVEDYCYTISDHGRCISGSVLEAVAAWVADMIE